MLDINKILSFLLGGIILSGCLCKELSKSVCSDDFIFVMPADNGTVIKIEATERNTQLYSCVRNAEDVAGRIFLCPRLNKETEYLLYTRENKNAPQRLVAHNENSIKKSHFDKNKRTIVLFHGWLSDSSTSVISKIKDVLLENHDYNIISVEWTRNSKEIIYHVSSRYMVHTGIECVTFFRYLISYGAAAKSMHFIGYGFGGQMAAYIAKSISKTNLLSRYTGLDVSEPIVCSDSYKLGLVSSSEDEMNSMTSMSCFVYAIHTSRFGQRSPYGHADFYPDGGNYQKTCIREDKNEYSCSHLSAAEYFINSIKNKDLYVGVKCKSFEDLERNLCDDDNSNTTQKVVMGFYTPLTARGVFYVASNRRMYGVKKKQKVTSMGIRNFSLKTEFMINTLLVVWCECLVTFII